MPERSLAGRAGRLFLIDRLAAARRAFELLDRKHQLLVLEERRFAERGSVSERRFIQACEKAELWGGRLGILGGDDAFARVSSEVQGKTQASVLWINTIGVIHPDGVQCDIAELSPAADASASASVRPAASAYRQALAAAAEHAAVSEGHRRVAAELLTTRARRRALEHHLLPQLEAKLAALELNLEEMDREEQVQTRWVKRRQAARDLA